MNTISLTYKVILLLTFISTPAFALCPKWQTPNPNWPYIGCVSCGGDGEPACSTTQSYSPSKCREWRTSNPNYPNYCIACGGDGYYRCSTTDSESPAVCRENRTINAMGLSEEIART